MKPKDIHRHKYCLIESIEWYKGMLTVFALALLDEGLILDVLVASLAVEPRTITRDQLAVEEAECTKYGIWDLPLDLIGALCYEKALRVCLNLGATRIYGYFTVCTLLGAFDLDSKQQQLELGETQSTSSGRDG